MALTTSRPRRTFNSTKKTSSSSSIPQSTTKLNATGQDYSVTGNAKADAINLAKANAISASKSKAKGEAYDPEAFNAEMGANPVVPDGMKVPETKMPEMSTPAPSAINPQTDVIRDNVTGQSFT